MTISSSLSADNKTLTIHVEGRFDANSLDEFRKCYESAAGESPVAYVVDLKQAIYLDSSALGMLLVLRDFAGGESSRITISNCSTEVKKIFTISSFEQLFTIR
jgi:HptB-dependent secretion and biofilm anti anti-sigma factor